MVGVFRRSLSLNPSRPSTSKPAISRHTRSISLPCRSHPAISHLRETTADLLRSWPPANNNDDSSSESARWLREGMGRLKSLHDILDDALSLPNTQESLRRQPSAAADKLLDHFLRLADAFGIFRTLIMSLREDLSSAAVALRRRDESAAAKYLSARKTLAKEMRALVSAVKPIAINYNSTGSPAVICVGDDEVVGAIVGVVEATAAVSLSLFAGVAASAGKRRRRSTSSAWTRWLKNAEYSGAVTMMGELEGVEKAVTGLRKKSDAEIRKASKSMQDLEASVAALETAGERVFRGLINARVSLLNTFTR